LGAVIDAYHDERQASSAGTVAEYFLNVARKQIPLIGRLGFVYKTEDARRALAEIREHGKLGYKMEDAQRAIADIREPGVYSDLHNWVFTPSSFRMIIEDLYQLGYIRLREVGWFRTIRGEFFVALGSRGRGYRASRMTLAKANRRET